VNLAHVPHRYWPENPLRHGVPQLRVAGGVNTESLVDARDFYSDMAVPLFQVEPIEIAELSKIVENAYRYLQIAFAEELKLFCNKNMVNFNILRRACNTKWNIDIPEARTGIGGTCLPKDIRYLIHTAKMKDFEPEILLSAIEADKKYVSEITKKVCYT
jgi:UDP-N-acetyl-D-mannosaminuronate dehydrogenase